MSVTSAKERPPPIPNIIIFGETGSGKSSIINLLANKAVAYTASSARRCTYLYKCYQITAFGSTFNIYDTAGIGEGETGQRPNTDAIVQLYSLILSLRGVSLLIFCMHGPRLKAVTHDNWRFFHEIVCKRRVPIVLAITGLENEDVMRDWWPANEGVFQQHGLLPNGVACITTIKGKRNAFEAEYEESRATMQKVLKDCALEKPWMILPVEWFRNVAVPTFKTPWCTWVHEDTEIQKVVGPGIQAMMDLCDFSVEDAKRLEELLTEW
jgi:50S ribosome-binding GTPase